MGWFIGACMSIIMYMTIIIAMQTINGVSPKKVEAAMDQKVNVPVRINGSN